MRAAFAILLFTPSIMAKVTTRADYHNKSLMNKGAVTNTDCPPCCGQLCSVDPYWSTVNNALVSECRGMKVVHVTPSVTHYGKAGVCALKGLEVADKKSCKFELTQRFECDRHENCKQITECCDKSRKNRGRKSRSDSESDLSGCHDRREGDCYRSRSYSDHPVCHDNAKDATSINVVLCKEIGCDCKVVIMTFNDVSIGSCAIVDNCLAFALCNKYHGFDVVNALIYPGLCYCNYSGLTGLANLAVSGPNVALGATYDPKDLGGIFPAAPLEFHNKKAFALISMFAGTLEATTGKITVTGFRHGKQVACVDFDVVCNVAILHCFDRKFSRLHSVRISSVDLDLNAPDYPLLGQITFCVHKK